MPISSLSLPAYAVQSVCISVLLQMHSCNYLMSEVSNRVMERKQHQQQPQRKHLNGTYACLMHAYRTYNDATMPPSLFQRCTI